ncbi:hypothetical protein ACFQ61_08270 [Streptomyces sp. NPDC056500]|uniref:hypothetical protein n=1 Tax=Streptomyces sp. NPDC056500 TaxID=3345840 RepID=UPI0036B3E99E
MPSSLLDSGVIPKRGHWYALLSDHGEGVGMLTKSYNYTSPSGDEHLGLTRQLYVLDVVGPATYGVGYNTESSALCMWVHSPAPGRVAVHHLSLPIGQFIELVGVGEEPPEYGALQSQMSQGES